MNNIPKTKFLEASVKVKLDLSNNATKADLRNARGVDTPFLYKQSIFDPLPENCLSFSKQLPQRTVYQLYSRWFINFYCLNIQTFWMSP